MAIHSLRSHVYSTPALMSGNLMFDDLMIMIMIMIIYFLKTVADDVGHDAEKSQFVVVGCVKEEMTKMSNNSMFDDLMIIQ